MNIAASIVLIAAAAVLVWLNLPREDGPPVPSRPIAGDGELTMGSRTARIVLIEFSDFECPYCERFARDTLPTLKREFVDTGHVQLVFKHLPLAIHQNAVSAAIAAECAGNQGQFEAMHDQLFSPGTSKDEDNLLRVAREMGLDMAGFGECFLKEGKAADRVARDSAEAASLEITGTPTFLVGTRLPDGRVRAVRALSGARPPEHFRAEIDAVRRGRVLNFLILTWWLWAGIVAAIMIGWLVARAANRRRVRRA